MDYVRVAKLTCDTPSSFAYAYAEEEQSMTFDDSEMHRGRVQSPEDRRSEQIATRWLLLWLALAIAAGVLAVMGMPGWLVAVLCTVFGFAAGRIFPAAFGE